METPKDAAAKGRRKVGSGEKIRRAGSASNLSSTSGDDNIHVARQSPRSGATSTLNGKAMMLIGGGGPGEVGMLDGNGDYARSSFAEVSGGRLLIIRVDADRLRGILSGGEKAAINTENGDGDVEGRNDRGTYSKEFTLRHPEIKWVHRGQGRYLPASEIKKEAVSASGLRRLRHSQIQDEAEAEIKAETCALDPALPSLKRTSTSDDIQPRRKRRAIEEQLNDSLSTPPTYGLRHRYSDQLTPSASEDRATRFARRSRPSGDMENSRRATLRTQNSQAIIDASDEDDEDDEDGEDDEDDEDDEDMSDESGGGGEQDGDRRPAPRRGEQTYDKKYVDAHPGETFHHVGNGWYRRGERPTEKLEQQAIARRKSSNLKLTQERDGSYSIDGDRFKSVHKTQLDQFPGLEFHHTGNGWYKLGPDPNGHRSSITVPPVEDDDSAELEGANLHGTFDKGYVKSHPEFEWIHKGNGRYRRKSNAEMKQQVPTHHSPPRAPAPAPASRRRKSSATYSRAWVESHPHEEYYHSGNGRYKKGARPVGVQATAIDESEEDDDDDEETPDSSIDKAYVNAQPTRQLQHRGQGKTARGRRLEVKKPRKEEASAAAFAEESEHDPNELVDTKYVDAHPHLNFHHKGQGRWARGLPPPTCGNKTAIRGPAKFGMEEQKEPTPDPGPPMAALLRKEEGPELWPHLTWHYRGGGKWGRMTKQEVEDMQKQQAAAQISAAGGWRKRKNRSSGCECPGAQLAREAAVAQSVNGSLHGGDEDTDMGEARAVAKMKRKRGRLNPRAAFGDGHGGTHSGSQSNVPTPKPRMLEPEEDVLSPEDLPVIFRDWNEEEELEGDELDRQLRATFKALNTDLILASLTKFDPATRSLGNLKQIADNAAKALRQIQEEYLELDKKTAMHARVPRKPAKGGRVPADPQIFEDKKEAELYDYVFDPRKLGYQDPEAQRIIRDAEGRELRKRRNRAGIEPHESVPGWHFGEPVEGVNKRVPRQPQRLDNIVADAPRKRQRTNANGLSVGSVTPDRGNTPMAGTAVQNGVPAAVAAVAGAKGVPKRIMELQRGDSATPIPSDGGSGITKTTPRKGRPPGSKNLHKRKDAGIKKGPRKPKTPGSSAEGVTVDAPADTPEPAQAAPTYGHAPTHDATPPIHVQHSGPPVMNSIEQPAYGGAAMMGPPEGHQHMAIGGYLPPNGYCIMPEQGFGMPMGYDPGAGRVMTAYHPNLYHDAGPATPR